MLSLCGEENATLVSPPVRRHCSASARVREAVRSRARSHRGGAQIASAFEFVRTFEGAKAAPSVRLRVRGTSAALAGFWGLKRESKRCKRAKRTCEV